jgi:CBS domain-containing protein
MSSIPENLKTTADQIHQTGEGRRETVRTLLSWFGAQRRGLWVVESVRDALRQVELDTKPDFEVVYIDSEVELIPAEKTAKNQNAGETNTVEVQQSGGNGSAAPVMVVAAKDPVPRIGMLAAANQKPTSVCRDADVTEAVTLMMLNDFSQLPVMQGDREVSGMISWKSIGQSRAKGKSFQYVRECMAVDVKILNYDVPLFEVLQTIVDQEAVLARGPDNRITGLVTTSDITLQFKALSESFLLLGEIENHVRRILAGKFALQTLKEAIDPGDEKRKQRVRQVSDLAFGEYIRLIEVPGNWCQLGLQLDQRVIVERLSKIRNIRNDVMHFHPDGISDADVITLRETVHFMQQL